jgi:chromate reductase, NAD(P)H dehydrogenase (quinone)
MMPCKSADLAVPSRFLLMSGSLRRASTNAALLRTTVQLAPEGIDCSIYDRLDKVPPFNPDEDRHPLHPEVQWMRDTIHEADAILFSTPEYAGALPGTLKNWLDWAIGDDQVGSIYEKPVGWLNASPRGADGAHRELRTVLSYAHARIIEAACVRIPVTGAMIGADGLVHDDTSRSALAGALAVVAGAI